MTEHPIFIFIALLILGYGIFSPLAEKSIITAPRVFVAIGILVSFLPLEFTQKGTRAPYVKILAELTLLIVLFLDASTGLTAVPFSKLFRRDPSTNPWMTSNQKNYKMNKVGRNHKIISSLNH